MKELVLKKRLELEDICRKARIEPDMSTAPEKANALIDSGMNIVIHVFAISVHPFGVSHHAIAQVLWILLNFWVALKHK